MGTWARWAVFCVSTLAAGSCSGGRPQPTQPTEMSAQARAYLNELIGLMQEHSINRLTIDWNNFRSTVFAEAGAAQIPADTYPAIQLAFRLLGDGHGTYRAANGFVVNQRTRACTPSSAGTPALPATIGYVKVPTF